jgi:phosphomannomutase
MTLQPPNTLVLFDVDGTITEPRKLINIRMIKALRELARHSEIGFVSGSDLDDIKEQLWPALNDPIIKQNCHILPCNGTKYLIPTGDEELLFSKIYEMFMADEIGSAKFNKIMEIICILQGELAAEGYDIPFTGHFIHNRGSMINWSVIGREAITVERQLFQAADKLYNIRKKYLDKLRERFKEEEIEVVTKLGGNTSFDIYPPGWDKTFVFTHFNKADWDFWFVGDRCGRDGNDYEIFEKLKPHSRAFEVGGPDETIEIIDFHILRYIGA